ncbi:hypothetical protein K501DRAFT_338241 [Backusella circina FSU 941]|nr:hypothetical protein K501DRAFT_338241 [Backusella circina FSU 941]
MLIFTKFISLFIKPKDKELNHIVIIGFGSTYSTFAFSSRAISITNEPYSNLIEAGDLSFQLPGILCFREPSAVYYNSNSKYTRKFGEKAIRTGRNPRHNGTVYQDFQPQLYKELSRATDVQSHDSITMTDVTSHYLRDFVKTELAKVKQNCHKFYLSKSRIRYVMTTSKECSVEEKDLLRQLFVQAGLVSMKQVDGRVSFISEKEALKHYCYQYLCHHSKVNGFQRFMVLDAGGKTVNAYIFKVGSSSSIHDPQLEEVSSNNRSACGSTIVDDNFKELVVDKFHACSIKLPSLADLDNLTDEFIKNTKLNFIFIDGEFISFPIPPSCHITFSVPDLTHFIVHGTLRITHKELSEKVFKPVTNDIIEFIQSELEALPDSQNLDAILLVGGFGQSSFLYKEIKDSFQGKPIGANMVLQLPDGELAACRGAASYGLNL